MVHPGPSVPVEKALWHAARRLLVAPHMSPTTPLGRVRGASAAIASPAATVSCHGLPALPAPAYLLYLTGARPGPLTPLPPTSALE